MTVSPLSADMLYTKCDLDFLPFETTRDLEDLATPLGQERAIKAIDFCINVNSYGYNLFCVGAEGTGKESLVRQILEKERKNRPAPSDWCYVYNFKMPHKPTALKLPAGRARAFAKDMEKMIETLKVTLPAAFEDEQYVSQVKQIEESFRDQKTQYFDSIQKNTTGKNVSVLRMPVGLVVAPTRDGEVLSPEAFEKLPEAEQQEVLAELNQAQEELEAAVRDVPKWEKEQREQMRDLDERFTKASVGHFIDDLKRKYRSANGVKEYLEDVYQDIIDNVSVFLDDDEDSSRPQNSEDGDEQPVNVMNKQKTEGPLRRYKVNVLVEHAKKAGAPVVFLEHPITQNLIGRVERQQVLGALITDFNMIKAGALHNANGGYLVMDAKDLLSHPTAWEALKRALRSKKITLDPPSEDGMMTAILEPETIPLDIKVILMGEPELYYSLVESDPDFPELFKVQANFMSTMEKTRDRTGNYARLIATLARKHGLRPLSKAAVERLIEYASRLAADVEKLTAHVSTISDVMREANYCAMSDKADVIDRPHVDEAIEGRKKRADRLQERMMEQISRGTVMIDTNGAVVGQINGLAVYEYGQASFGRPSRITCLTRVGKGDVLDIEREVELGGPIHTKGVLILSSFLASKYSQNAPLSMTASLVFEQSYGEVDGDSASSAELYAMLSALSGLPIKQSLAVTGSVNQFGQIQAIGGVNEKIEGFFDTCVMRGLTGEQGVVIPKANVKNLMLRKDVVQACRDGTFAVYAVETVDEGISLLTGVPAGEKQSGGTYPQGTVNAKVQEKLLYYLKQNVAYQRFCRDKPQAALDLSFMNAV